MEPNQQPIDTPLSDLTLPPSQNNNAKAVLNDRAKDVVPKKTGAVERFFEKFSRISTTEKAVFTQNLYVMTKSGISLSVSLETLSQQTKSKRFRVILGDVRHRIEKGEKFSDALKHYVQYFSEIYINMIAAGEASGKLETILQQLAIHLKKERTLVSKVKSAMFYPVIVVVAMVLIGVGMLVFVIPRITEIFAEANASLPLPTRIFIAMSDFLVNYWYMILPALIVLFILFRLYIKRPSGRRVFDSALLHTPIVGTIIRKIQLARFTRTLHSLLQTDIPIVESFQIIERTLSNALYKESMSAAAQALKHGISVSDALKKRPKLFPPMVIQMMSIGEQSGALDTLANEIANFYEEDVDTTMANFSSIIEPVLLLILGLGVGSMAVAILLPMYSLTEAI